MTLKRNGKGLLFFLVLLVVCLIAVFLVIGTLVITRVVFRESTDDLSSLRYYYINPSTNQSIKGIATIFEHLKDGDYITYYNEDSSLVLIGEEDLQEYECTGVCYCDVTDTERRFVHPTLGSSVVIGMVIAAGGAIGLSIFLPVLRNMCIKSMEEKCKAKDVKSDFNECSPIEESNKHGVPYEQANSKYIRTEFTCSGDCLQNEKIVNPEHKAEAEKFKCRSLQLELDDVLVVESLDQIVDLKIPEREDLAEGSFIENYLHPFCRENSLFKGTKQDVSGRVTDERFHMCVGRFSNFYSNPTVNCEMNTS